MASCTEIDPNSNNQSDDIFLARNMPIRQDNENIASTISCYKENRMSTSESSKSSEIIEKNPDSVHEIEEKACTAESSDSGYQEVQALSRFQDDLSTILKETMVKIMAKSKELREDTLAEQKIALKERERHEREKQELYQELKDCHHAIETLKFIAHKNTEVLMCMDKKLEQQQNTNVLMKSFLAWRTIARERKQKDLLLWVATKHYEQKLKRKVFNAWLSHLKLSWKKKMELKVTMDVYENQKLIVQNYEAKIRDLQENASEVDKRLKTLHRSFEDSVQMAYMHGLNFSKERPVSSNSGKDFTGGQPSTEEEDRMKINSFYEKCSFQPNTELSGNTFIYSDTPPVNYKDIKEVIQKPMTKVHPSALPKRLPVMGTAIPQYHYAQDKTSSISLRPDNDQTIIIERHIPVIEPSSSHFLPKSSSTKSRNQKKIL